MSCNTYPVALVSASVGLNPMVSMLYAFAAEKGSRPVCFVHGARNDTHHPLDQEVRDLVAWRSNVTLHVTYSKPHDEDEIGTACNSVGRVDGALLGGLIDNSKNHYFLCGPTGIMAGVQSKHEEQDVPADFIHTNTFGPKG